MGIRTPSCMEEAFRQASGGMLGGYGDYPPDEVEGCSTYSELATIEGRKLFVGGLSWDTDDTALRLYFELFGRVDESIVVYNKTAQISRGFGFVTFAEQGSAQAALDHPESHRVNGKTVEAKLAVQKGDQVTLSLEEKMAKQVFVGGLPQNITSDQLKDWAATKWGSEQVVNAIVVLNMTTKLTRGFGFVNFVDSVHVEAALNGDRSQYLIQGKQFEVKRAQTQDRRHRHQRGRGMGRSKGKGAGRGRGRDSYQQFTPWESGGVLWDSTNSSQGMMGAGNYVRGGLPPANGNLMYPAYGGFPVQPGYGGQQQQFFIQPTGEFVASNEAAGNPQFAQQSYPNAMMPTGMGAMNNPYYPAQPVMQHITTTTQQHITTTTQQNVYSVESAMNNMTLSPPFPNGAPPAAGSISNAMTEMIKHQAQQHYHQQQQHGEQQQPQPQQQQQQPQQQPPQPPTATQARLP